jgi:hypothetical protein
MVSAVVLEMGAQERVIAGVFCTVAVTRTAARSELDWAARNVATRRRLEAIRERSMRTRPSKIMYLTECQHLEINGDQPGASHDVPWMARVGKQGGIHPQLPVDDLDKAMGKGPAHVQR